MADVVDTATRSRMMSGIKGKDTKPEVFLRKELHARGFRYRLGGCGLPGKPDLTFPARRIVIFVHGCFWHCHDCKYFKWPGSNQEFWQQKLQGNSARDKRVKQLLQKLGWRVLTVWECELRKTGYMLPNAAVDRVSRILADVSK
ncbi:very short patch repair endonuclease [Polaromonas aquatica]|uniref:very short patch repair endonuclease n=1 Tax=Polaromonas aquatica TaxID=332657 RepID=UPI003D6487AB